MRLFTGVFPPDTLQREVSTALAQTGALTKVRWIAPENLHLTLVFLGDLPEAEAARAASALETAAAAVPPFEVEVGGLRAFPNPRRARVLVLEVGQGAPDLTRLHAAVLECLPPGLRPDVRPFSPHLTLARLRNPPGDDCIAALGRELEGLRWRFPVAAAHLVHSHLTSAGSVYRRQATAALGG